MLLIIFTSLMIGLVISSSLFGTKATLQKREALTVTYVDQSTHRFKEENRLSARKSHHQFTTAPIVKEEIVYEVLQRTCNTIYQRGIALNCDDAESVYTVWGFAGVVGDKGDLEDAWSGSTTDTFTCGDEDAYGRGLIQKALPLSHIKDNNWSYDFSDISDPKAYPCGYDEIVVKD